jgi:hypothetical protein
MRSSILTGFYSNAPFAIEIKQLPLGSLNNMMAGLNLSVIRCTNTGDDSIERICSAITPEGPYFSFDYHDPHDQIIFLIAPSGKKVFYSSTDSPTSRSINSLLNSIVVKCCLQLQQKFCLHTSGVRVGEQVILFIGKKGAGKSTLSAFFNIKGHEIWCDDYSVLDDRGHDFLCWRGESSAKIDKTAINQFNIAQHSLKSVFAMPDHWVEPGESTDYGNKYYFESSPAASNQLTGLPLGAIFILQERGDDDRMTISPGNLKNAFGTLMEEMMLPWIAPKKYKKFYFGSVSAVLGRTKVFSVQAPDDLSRLDDVYSAIIKALN